MERLQISLFFLLTLFVASLGLTTTTSPQTPSFKNPNPKSGKKHEMRAKREYQNLGYPQDPYYYAAGFQDMEIDGYGYGYPQQGDYGYGYPYPGPGGVFGFPRGIFGFPRGIFRFPPRGIFGFPLGFQGFPGGFGGFPGGPNDGGYGGGYGGVGPGDKSGGGDMGSPGYGGKTEVKGKKVNSHH